MINGTKGLVFFALISLSLALRAQEVITISSVDEYAKHMKSDKPMIAMFTASWCGPCKQTKPHFFELAKEYADVTFCLIDIDNKELSSLTGGVSGVPTFIGVCKNKEYVRISGGRPLAGLKKLVETFRADVMGQKKAPEKKSQEPTEADYYKMGLDHYKKIVAVCSKKDFDAAGLDEAMLDQAIMPLTQKLATGGTPAELVSGFKSFKAYARGAKKALAEYTFQQRNLQDGIIRYNIYTIDMLLAAPDLATYVQKQMKIGEAIQQKMRLLTWETIAQLDLSTL